jgi:hypothetical protein
MFLEKTIKEYSTGMGTTTLPLAIRMFYLFVLGMRLSSLVGRPQVRPLY